MQIIRVQLEHAELIAPLFDAYRQFYKQSSNLAGAREFVTDRLKKNESVIFLAVEKKDSSPLGIGFTQLYPSFSSTNMRRLWILNDLYVSPNARKKGIGEALLFEIHRSKGDGCGNRNACGC